MIIINIIIITNIINTYIVTIINIITNITQYPV
jgi:hypothetical protein